MGGFPSGQRGQTVNLLSTTSVVRIHHLPPELRASQDALFSWQKTLHPGEFIIFIHYKLLCLKIGKVWKNKGRVVSFVKNN